VTQRNVRKAVKPAIPCGLLRKCKLNGVPRGNIQITWLLTWTALTF